MSQPQDSEWPSPLPRRGSAEDGRWGGLPTARRRPSTQQIVEDALHSVSGQEANVSGMLLASTDGLVLAADTDAVHLDTVAAMAAAAASIGSQFTDQANVGEASASLFEGDSGHVAVFPVAPRVLLVVFGRKDTTMGLFNIAARNALFLLQQTINEQWALDTRQ
ncbi:roadblock/LC7 domain-containing protein [Actinophytocola oryzae]|uniref:Roadblock/LAMTOR2 domain-containing protein n=1 Tax=Actinophytocola oryzae TaxID=502181 RepID=A0A4R7VID8_9PSEU|nr:roadblock/LC7 domain-containing protein [Actinophytocola oryzae]TDV48869.1 hypothetical protein CLV71_108229 [Actinophytocola oryzae]